MTNKVKPTFLVPLISDSGPEFYPSKHPCKTYAAQQREAKKRRKNKNNKS